MKNYDAYIESYDKDQRYFGGQISDRESKAFDYGILVVRNAVLIAGGGLLSIPAIVGLSSEVSVDMAEAGRAGAAFALALIVSILGAYVIHLNWMLHSSAWHKHWEDRQHLLEQLHLSDAPKDELELQGKEHFSRSIQLTFWLPHLLTMIYLICIAYGFFGLYNAMGISS